MDLDRKNIKMPLRAQCIIKKPFCERFHKDEKVLTPHNFTETEVVKSEQEYKKNVGARQHVTY